MDQLSEQECAKKLPVLKPKANPINNKQTCELMKYKANQQRERINREGKHINAYLRSEDNVEKKLVKIGKFSCVQHQI